MQCWCLLQGQRALDFVLRNQGLIDKTLLFDIELLKIIPNWTLTKFKLIDWIKLSAVRRSFWRQVYRFGNFDQALLFSSGCWKIDMLRKLVVRTINLENGEVYFPEAVLLVPYCQYMIVILRRSSRVRCRVWSGMFCCLWVLLR